MQFPRQVPQVVPIGTPEGRKDRLLIAVLVALIVAAVGYAIVLHGDLTQLQVDSSRTIEAHLKTIALRTQQVEALDALATRVDTFNREFGARVGRLQVDNIEGNIKSLEQKGHLPDDAKKSLDEFEKSVTEIDAMTIKMKEFEKYLGAPITVKRGETHAHIAERYLVAEAKLTQKQAEDVVRHTAMDFDVEPGNQVFNLYHDGILLSTVTQGTARRPPMSVQWARRHATQVHTQELEERVKELEAKLAAIPPPPEEPKERGGTLIIKHPD